MSRRTPSWLPLLITASLILQGALPALPAFAHPTTLAAAETPPADKLPGLTPSATPTAAPAINMTPEAQQTITPTLTITPTVTLTLTPTLTPRLNPSHLRPPSRPR